MPKLSYFRNPKCAAKDFQALAKGKAFPKTTVIITFRDEPRSTLLRTVASVFERTPAEFIQEIILVDDNNDDATVGKELEVLEKVKVMRNDKREGLIRSRIKATKAAQGEVLVFLDSHCEVITNLIILISDHLLDKVILLVDRVGEGNPQFT